MEFTTFRYGLISVYLDNRDIVVSTDVILATGQKPKQLVLDGKVVNCCMYSANAEVVGYSPEQSAVVIGNDYIAAKLAADIAPKYKHVFLCTDHIELDCAKRYADKARKTANISIMTNSKPVSCKTETYTINNKKYEMIKSVAFDTYMNIDCDQIYAVLGKEPDVNGVNQTMYKLSPEGTIIVNENCESVAIPYLYAIGMISNNYTKTTYNNMLAYIQNK